MILIGYFFHPIRRTFSDQWDAACYLQICISSLTFSISSICKRFAAPFGGQISESGASINRKFILRYFCCIYTSKGSKFGVKCSQKHLYKTTAFARFPNSRPESRRSQLFTRKRFWHLWRAKNDSDTVLIFQYDVFFCRTKFGEIFVTKNQLTRINVTRSTQNCTLFPGLIFMNYYLLIKLYLIFSSRKTCGPRFPLLLVFVYFLPIRCLWSYHTQSMLGVLEFCSYWSNFLNSILYQSLKLLINQSSFASYLCGCLLHHNITFLSVFFS